MIKIENDFKDIALEYFNFLDFCKQNNLHCTCCYYEYGIHYKIPRKINKQLKQYIFSDKYGNTKDKYSNISNLEKYNNSNFFIHILQYIQFILFMEKCYMYKNCKLEMGDYIYADKDGDKLEICNFDNNFKIIISFEDTNIMYLGLENSTDPLINFIENDSKGKPNTLTFINFEIKRSNSNNDTFKFVIDEEPKFNDNDDEILFNNIKNYIAEFIYKDFINIINNSPLVYNNEEINIRYFINTFL